MQLVQTERVPDIAIGCIRFLVMVMRPTSTIVDAARGVIQNLIIVIWILPFSVPTQVSTAISNVLYFVVPKLQYMPKV